MNTSVNDWDAYRDTGAVMLDSWLLLHSAAMCAAIGTAALLRSSAPVVLIAALSFALLCYGARHELAGMRPIGGYANRVTACRLILVLLAAAFVTVAPAWLIVSMLALNVALDFLDGRIARHYGQITRLGSALDAETDAIFVSIAYLYFLLADGFGIWVVVPAVLPYAYRLALRRMDGPTPGPRRERTATFLAGVNFVVLLVALAADTALRLPILILSVGIVLTSFSISLLRRKRRATPVSL